MIKTENNSMMSIIGAGAGYGRGDGRGITYGGGSGSGNGDGAGNNFGFGGEYRCVTDDDFNERFGGSNIERGHGGFKDGTRW